MEIKSYQESETYRAKLSTDDALKLAVKTLENIQSLLDPNAKPTSVAGKIYDMTVVTLDKLGGV